MAAQPDVAAVTAAADTEWLRRRGPGWLVVAGKELSETLTSLRFAVLLAILGLAALAPVYATSGAIRDAAEQASGAAALFLALFTLGADPVPSFVGLVGFVAPLLGIAFGFDAINGERAQGTLARLLSHPIHRDDLINGKFVAGLAAIAVAVVSMAMLVAGLGIVRLGIVPSVGEVARMIAWVVVTILYIGLWLAIAMLCSVLSRRAATSALIAIGLWLALSLFGVLLAQLIAGFLDPMTGSVGTEAALRHAQLQQQLSIVNPGTVYAQATLALLNPGATAVVVPGLAEAIQLSQQIPTQLSLQQSLLIVWPQVVGLLAAMVLCFVASYIVFLRQEVRA
ncbi:MAG TPA: ABC transporter permease [Candidatus Limnocylindria bacterium]|jgi:ABC-2 type transport system permease protein|nr:ABC transporter permease [Candidatus Limnocylindria bacterium]